MKKLLAALGLLLLACLPAEAALCPSVPYTFVNGATADATQVNANFTTLLACFNNSTAHSGANSDITSLGALTSPPAGTGSLVFTGSALTNVQSGSTTAITVGSTNPNGFALNYGNILVFTPTVNNTTTYPQVTLTIGAASTVNLYKWSTAGPIALTGNELLNGQVAQATYDGTEFVLLSQVAVPPPVPVVTPGGRLTLHTGTPVMGSTAYTGVATVYFTPYPAAATPGYVPVWNGSFFANVAITEQSQALSDTTYSPAAAVSGACYDYFEWSPTTNTYVASRGPAWTNVTTRGYTLSLVSGILVNPSQILNGPAGGYGVYLGTVCTDAGGATVSYNPTPAAASGGPSGGAQVGLWNEYNRVSVGATAQDSKATWTYSTATTWEALDFGSSSGVNNRVTIVVGQAEDAVEAKSAVMANVASSGAVMTAVGVNSVSAPSGMVGGNGSYSGTNGLDMMGIYDGVPSAGQNYYQALQYNTGSTTATFYGALSGAQMQQISAQLRY